MFYRILVATAFIVLGNIFLVAFGNHQSPGMWLAFETSMFLYFMHTAVCTALPIFWTIFFELLVSSTWTLMLWDACHTLKARLIWFIILVENWSWARYDNVNPVPVGKCYSFIPFCSSVHTLRFTILIKNWNSHLTILSLSH